MDEISGSGLQKTATHWGAEAGTWRIGRGIHWTEHPAVQERINTKVSGNAHTDPYQFFIDLLATERVTLPLARCLTLGCGAGDLEIGLSQYNFCQSHDAYDIASDAIARAKQRAHDEKIHHINYEVHDINKISLPAEQYDVVFGIQSIHHLSALEHVFSEVKKTLKPGGFFFLNEFVGPTKFQWTERQLAIVNALLQILPEKYRISLNDGKTVKKSFQRPTIAEMNRIDPSEAIRSSEIIPLLGEYFTFRHIFKLGGTILHLLLQDIAGNFDYTKNEDMDFLKSLFLLEDALIETGDIASDFTVIIVQKPL